MLGKKYHLCLGFGLSVWEENGSDYLVKVSSKFYCAQSQRFILRQFSRQKEELPLVLVGLKNENLVEQESQSLSTGYDPAISCVIMVLFDTLGIYFNTPLGFSSVILGSVQQRSPSCVIQSLLFLLHYTIATQSLFFSSGNHYPAQSYSQPISPSPKPQSRSPSFQYSYSQLLLDALPPSLSPHPMTSKDPQPHKAASDDLS